VAKGLLNKLIKPRFRRRIMQSMRSVSQFSHLSLISKIFREREASQKLFLLQQLDHVFDRRSAPETGRTGSDGGGPGMRYVVSAAGDAPDQLGLNVRRSRNREMSRELYYKVAGRLLQL
jgi:hypothetical protein